MKQIPALLAALAMALPAALAAAEEDQPWLKPDPAALKRWQEMRFGMFIHWGPVSLTAKEIGWSRGAPTPVETYDSLYKTFNPEKFNADEWVGIAKAAGMRYIVLTTKHHDGFCLWDTKCTDYNIMHTPFRRDVVRELADACKRQGVAFGAYHSVTDWYDPNWPVTSPGGKAKREKSDLDAYEKYLQAQTRELITGYGPLLTLWNDVPAMYGKERGLRTIELARRLQPDIVINNRTGAGGDYDTPEQKIGGFNMERPWESCMTVSAHNRWAWGGSDDGVKPLSACLLMLVRGAGGDGNVLLNVGPRPDGVIDPAQANLLKEVGAWLEKYGESIYGTRGGPYKPTKSVVSTRKGNTVYLHITAWPEPVLALPPLPAKIVKSRALAGGEATVKQTEAGVEVAVPVEGRQAIDTVVALELDRPALELAPISVSAAGESLAAGKQAAASNVYQNDKRYGAAAAVDGESETRWATDANVSQCWLEVDLGKEETFGRATVEECISYGARVRGFELQVKDGAGWRTFYKGAPAGKTCDVTFEPVTARHVRLVIDGDKGPTISEFQLFAPKARPRLKTE
jgi:alpha-L-fucosidase